VDNGTNKTSVLHNAVNVGTTGGTTLSQLGPSTITAFNSAGAVKVDLVGTTFGVVHVYDAAGSLEASLTTLSGYGELFLRQGAVNRVSLVGSAAPTATIDDAINKLVLSPDQVSLQTTAGSLRSNMVRSALDLYDSSVQNEATLQAANGFGELFLRNGGVVNRVSLSALAPNIVLDNGTNKTDIQTTFVAVGTTGGVVQSRVGLGFFIAYDTSGATRTDLGLLTGAGNLDLYDSAGSLEARLSSASGFGELALRNAATEKVFLSANAVPEMRMDALRVVTTRRTGWSTATGTPNRSSFDTATVTLETLAEHVKAMIDDLHATAGHGLFGT
jgi:hypothetical protein